MRATLVLSTNGIVVGFKLCTGLAQLDLPFFDTLEHGPGEYCIWHISRRCRRLIRHTGGADAHVLCTTDNLFPAAFGVYLTYWLQNQRVEVTYCGVDAAGEGTRPLVD